MKLIIKTLQNTQLGTIELPEQFSEPVRPDLIVRAVQAMQANERQPYGADPRAGHKASAEVSRRRRNYRGSYGHGISRVPRKVMSRRGTRFNWLGAVAPGTVKGRQAHPPKAEKKWKHKMNTQEKKKAIRSALAATVHKELVASRGHHVPADYPFIVESRIESLAKTKEVQKTLNNLGLTLDLARAKERTINAGKAKRRNRKYKTKGSALLVVANKCTLLKSARNVPGITIMPVASLNAQALAPGCHPGRLTIFTQGAIEKLQK